MANEFAGDWDIRVAQQVKGTDMFLADRPKYTVPPHALTTFRFGFRINSNDYNPTADNMTMNGDNFTGSFTHNNTTYHVKARKFSFTGGCTSYVTMSGTCTYLVGVIGKPDLNLESGNVTATDVISFTAIKTS